MKENKKIWKLLELLNEFYKEKWDIFRAIQHNDRLKVFELENDDLVRDVAIISKEYWFIKWLVENDKIDIDKLKFQSDFMFPLWKDFDQMGSEDIEEYSEYESLLMLLSISDTPIEDLISYLK